MQRQGFREALAGGYFQSYELNLLEKAFLMQIHVLDQGVLSSYDVTFEGISRLLIEDETASSWERIELTDIWIESGPEGSSAEEWEILMSLWDVVHIRIRCASLLVDGEPLQ